MSIYDMDLFGGVIVRITIVGNVYTFLFSGCMDTLPGRLGSDISDNSIKTGILVAICIPSAGDQFKHKYHDSR
jgi:hypothetical protein